MLVGAAGSGKTCAALCLVDECGGWYLTLPEFCDMLNQARDGNLRSSSGYGITVTELWRDFDAAPVVVLDEIGCRDRVSDFHYETLKRCIDKREERPLVLVSNATLEEIAKTYDDRIASRMSGGTVVLCSGDMRLGDTAAKPQE